ncbi:MAG: sulfite reductase [Breznakibacter sp.]|nr:sulfite reductase [Breznakibacter sp.]
MLTEYSIDLTAKQLTDVLRKLPPRLYSISSSLDANPDEVHITVGAVRFEKNSREREGVASTFLADRVPEDGKIAVRIKQNEGFRLPQDGSAPAIMVGPGTGIAPFRAFLQQRENDGTDGKNWLFFGDQHFTTDFLYQTEILKWKNDGVLTNLDVAFSRDQEEKIYVQHRLKQKSKEVFEWLQNGSYFYVCGDMKKMAKDVKETLLQIIETEGKLSKEAAAEYFNNLKKSHRYQEDVY